MNFSQPFEAKERKEPEFHSLFQVHVQNDLRLSRALYLLKFLSPSYSTVAGAKGLTHEPIADITD